MNQIVKNRLEAFIRVRIFSAIAGLPANVRATALFALLLIVENEMTAAGTAQADGRGRYRGGSADRKRTATALRALIGRIISVAKVLDPVEFPDAAQQFRGPYSSSYQALIAAALAIKAAAAGATIKPAFVARGLAPDFDVELDDLIQALQEATERQYSGRGTQVGGTAGLLASSRRGLLYLQELDAIMKNILAGLPELLANWESASHIQQPPRRTTTGTGEPTTPPTEPVSGTTA